MVEITQIGIQNLGWRFYIIWTLFNGSFIPIVYFLYPETADRTLEDLDRYFRENHNVIVAGDPDAIASKRPLAYIEHEHSEIRRHSSVEGDGAGGAAAKYRIEQLERARSNSIAMSERRSSVAGGWRRGSLGGGGGGKKSGSFAEVEKS